MPIRAMQLEHADTMGILQAVHEVAARVAGAAASPALTHVERTLCEHIHLENNVLFPRALEVMSSRR
ncbi:MAG: hemerythrin domain-containing protein [Proteobacteria bacterium]|nr:hemerythrin domain-containing protein [Pseudomonadota bacterium]